MSILKYVSQQYQYCPEAINDLREINMPTMKINPDRPENEGGATVTHMSGAIMSENTTLEELGKQKEGIDANDPNAAKELEKPAEKVSQDNPRDVQVQPEDVKPGSEGDSKPLFGDQPVKDEVKKQNAPKK
jgi:hypothetical protein